MPKQSLRPPTCPHPNPSPAGRGVRRAFPNCVTSVAMRMSWPSPLTPLPPGEQPCLVSSDFYFVVPSVTMFYHRIEDCQQLAHAGHHGDLVGLAVAAQALVKSANDRVVDPRGEGRHVQNGAHLTPATPGSAAALMFAAIVMKGGDA